MELIHRLGFTGSARTRLLWAMCLSVMAWVAVEWVEAAAWKAEMPVKVSALAPQEIHLHCQASHPIQRWTITCQGVPLAVLKQDALSWSGTIAVVAGRNTAVLLEITPIDTQRVEAWALRTRIRGNATNSDRTEWYVGEAVDAVVIGP